MQQTEYELRNHLVSKDEPIKHVPDLMKDLNDVNFHSLYHVLWTLSSQRLLEQIRQEEREVKEVSK